LPDAPYSVNVDFFFGIMNQYCDYFGNEAVTDPAKLIDLCRTVNCDNPIKQIIPQEQRNQLKNSLRGFFKIE